MITVVAIPSNETGNIPVLFNTTNNPKFITGTNIIFIKLYTQGSFCPTACLNGTSAKVIPIANHASGEHNLSKYVSGLYNQGNV